jgi:hypothetical protein
MKYRVKIVALLFVLTATASVLYAAPRDAHEASVYGSL